MDKKSIIRKLTSRKFWLTVASFVSMLIVYFGADASKAEQVSALIIAGGSIICYLFAEALADSANVPDEGDTDEH